MNEKPRKNKETPSSEEKFSLKLSELFQKCENEILEKGFRDKIPRRRRLKTVVLEMKRDEIGFLRPFSFDKKIAEEPYYSEVSEEVFGYIQDSRAFSEFSKFLESDFELDENKANLASQKIIKDFIYRLMREKEFEPNPDEIRDYFLREIKGQDVPFLANVMVDGILPKFSEEDVCESVKIREAQKEDFEFYADQFLVRTYFRGFTSGVEIKREAKSFPDFQKKIFKLGNILRLFRVGTVNLLNYSMEGKSVLSWGGGEVNKVRSNNGRPAYILEKGDLNILGRFIEEMFSLEFEASRQPKGEYYNSLALDLYNKSLASTQPLESRLVQAMMGLEAIYLEHESEMSHKLSQRCSRLMSFLGEDPIVVFRRMKRSYGLRSKYVHGSAFDKEDHEKIRKYIISIWDYLRKSLVVRLFDVLRWKKKTKFLRALDNAILSEKSEIEFERDLDPLKKRFCTVLGEESLKKVILG